jgi:deazaflavin-dependent oxidoreductase (nitroreductase family)
MISESMAAAGVCLLETIGRATGRPRIIEIWFAANDARSTVYFLSGGRDRAHWVRNLRNLPDVRVRLGDDWFAGRGRILEGGNEELRARRLVAARYQGWREGKPFSSWARESLPVAVDLSE